MESEKTNIKSTRKRRRQGADAAISESAILSGDDTGKPYSIRTRRSQTKNTPADEDDNSDNEKSHSASSKSTPTTPTSTTTTTTTTPAASSSSSTSTTSPTDSDTSHSRSNSQALQVTRDLHAHFLSKVRDLAPTIPPSSSSKPAANSRPSSNPPTPTATTIHEAATINHSNASSPTSPSASAANNNTSQSVKELQNLISHYVQRQRALASANNSAPVSPSNPPTPRGSATPLIPANQSRGTIPVSASTIIANKFNNAMLIAANSTLHHNNNTQATQNHKHSMTGNSAGNHRNTAASRAANNRSMLDNSVPVMSLQYKQQMHEKRQRIAGTEEDYIPTPEDDSNYFLNAAQHELQNMEDELMFSDKLELMEQHIAYLERSVARRDRVIEKLHVELQEKDALIRSLPYELVTNWIAASRVMIGQ